MLKKVMKLTKTPSIPQKRSLQRSLAELTNVHDVAFDGSQAILQLYSDIPDEILMEQAESTKLEVMSLR